MKQLINHREWECFWCKVKLKKKEFKKRNWVFICQRCWYYNSESIFKEYKEINSPKLVFWVDTQESIKIKNNKKWNANFVKLK